MNYQIVFRSQYGQFAAWGLLGFSVFFLAMVWYMDGFVQMLMAAPFPLGLTYFTWWIWSWPEVVVDRRGVTVRNQIRTWAIPWDKLVKAQAQWGLYLYAAPNEDAEGAPYQADGSDPSRSTPGNQVSASKRVERTAGGELTIGAVDPVNLDPDDLAHKTRIYASAVPAKGGFRTTTSKTMPEVPSLDLTSRNRVVLRVTPMAAARIIEEEKFYLDNPAQRPESHLSRTDFQVGEDHPRLTARINWLQAGGFALFVAYWIWLIV